MKVLFCLVFWGGCLFVLYLPGGRNVKDVALIDLHISLIRLWKIKVSSC